MLSAVHLFGFSGVVEKKYQMYGDFKIIISFKFGVLGYVCLALAGVQKSFLPPSCEICFILTRLPVVFYIGYNSWVANIFLKKLHSSVSL